MKVITNNSIDVLYFSIISIITFFCYKMELRDAVHDFVQFTWEERKLLDIPVMQRLRRIKQLALASLVYPGAVHTRFDHSIGVFHIASRLADRLIPEKEKDEYYDAVRFASLLHDIGHGPFSHVSEFAFSQFVNRDNLGISENEQIHEHLGWRIIESNKDIAEVLSRQSIDRIISILRREIGWGYIKGIISGPLDADKQDYLLRDSHFCGVKYGIFDLPRLLQSLEIVEDAEEKYLAVAFDSIHSIEQYVLAKYYLTTQVYCHKIRLITDEMLKRAILLGVEVDNISFLKELYSCLEFSDGYIQNYLSWTDDRLTNELLSDGYASTCAGRLFHCLHNRDLWKVVFDVSLDEKNFPDREVRSRLIGEMDRKLRRTLENKIASELRVSDPNFTVINVFSIKSVRAGLGGEEGPLLVKNYERPLQFEEVSTLFKSIDKSMEEQRVQVYAPISFSDDPATKIREKKEYHEKVEAIINEVLKKNNEETGHEDATT